MSFERAFSTLMRHEGYYANIVGDRGGETYRGIARNIHPDWKGWQTIDDFKRKHGPIARNQYIPDPKLDQFVKDFYRANYWDRIKGNEIHHPDLAVLIFDSFVHSNKTAIRLLQQAANSLGAKLAVDGFFGQNTLNTINSLSPAKLHDKLKELRRSFLIEFSKKPGQAQFLKGWLNRIDSFPDLEKKNSFPDSSRLAS